MRTKDGKIYARVTYTDQLGKIREVWRKAETRTEAKELIKQILRTLDDYGEKTIQAEYMTFKNLADYFIKTYLTPPEYINAQKVAGLRSYKTVLFQLKPAIEHFGNKLLRSIRWNDLLQYKLKRLKTPTPHNKQRAIATVNREMTYLRRVFQIAKREGWIINNPMRIKLRR